MSSLPDLKTIQAASKALDRSKLQASFQQLVAAVCAKVKQEDDANMVLQAVELLQQLEWNDVAQTSLVDVLWLESSMDCPAALVALIQQVQDRLPKALLLQNLDATLLQSAGIIENAADLQKKLRLLNTQKYYKQQKFNLLVEESQGYAKLLLALQNKEDMDLKELIGTFSLDPSRCVDLAIDVLEHEHFQCDFSEPSSQLVDVLSWQIAKLPQLLGFKLQDRKDTTALLKCMVWMVRRNLLSLTDMLRYLPPWLELLNTTYAATMKQDKARVQALSKVSLSGTSSKTTTEATVDTQPLQDTFAIRWMTVFLNQGDWPILEPILSGETWSKLAVLFPETFGGAICNYLHSQVMPLYEQIVPAVPLATTKKTKSDGTKMEDISLDHLLSKISKPLSYIRESGCILLHPILYSQLCRVVAASLRKEECSDACQDFIQTFLLPSLSRFPPSPALNMELWNVLDKLPYTTRYRLYRSWRGSGLERAALHSDKPLWLIAGELQAGKNVRYALKRLSKDTIRDTSRAVAKVCHSHPLVVFTTILNQIESYDNLVQVMVDALRFVTPLSLDVLGFCILSRLSGSTGGVNRSRLKEDGVNVSQWLQSLESFTGALYKRYPFLELRGILCYLMRRIKDGHVMELGVLRTLLKVSGGWAFADYAPAASLSSAQLEGRAGSTLLKRETMSFGVHQDFNLSSSNEIRRVLQDDDMGVSLLILLAQVRHQIVFESGAPKPVKLIGNLFDQCQVVMTILLDFLTDSSEASSLAKFAKSMPLLVELHGVYGVDVASSWMLCRPLIRAATSTLESGEVEDDEENDMDAALSRFRSSPTSKQLYQAMLPEATWEHMTTDLFEDFYSNILYDLFCPDGSYTTEIDRLKKEEERLVKQKPAPQSSVQPGPVSQKSEGEELERVKKAATKLSSDYSKQKEHVASMHSKFSLQKDSYFTSEKVSPAATMTFLTRCIYPRCMQGPDDALYCARFVQMLHEMETPGFGTLHFYDSLIIALSRALFGQTEDEAASSSIMLNEVWKLVSKWRYDEQAFKSELADTPGSFMVQEGSEEPVSVSYKDFESLYNKWHAAIGATVLGCLKSTEYMHKRNCLIMLTRMVDVYPTQPKMGRKFIEALEPLQDETYQLADIKASAQAYNMQLIKARDDGSWKEEDAADIKARAEKEQAAAAARQKKAQAQMAEMKRDSEKITEAIGEDSWDRRGFRGERRPMGPPGPREPLPDLRRGAPVNVGGHSFEPAHRDGGRGAPDDRRGGPGDRRGGPDDRRGGPDDRRKPPPPRDEEERWPRGASTFSSMASPPRRGDGRPGRDEGPSRGLEGRWERAGDRAAPSRGDREPPSRGTVGARSGGSSAGTKRSRPPTPEGDSEPSRGSKRVRVDSEQAEEAKHNVESQAGDGRGGRRGGDRRKRRRK